MYLKEFFLVYFPLTLIFLFVKDFLQNLLLLYPGNLFLALALSILIFRSISWWLYLYLFILGWLSGFESNLEIPTALYFVGIGILSKRLKDYLELNEEKGRIIWWVLNITLYIIFRWIFYFYQGDISLTWKVMLDLFVKSTFYFIATLFWAVICYKILKALLIKER
jgi:hypothetical protein